MQQKNNVTLKLKCGISAHSIMNWNCRSINCYYIKQILLAQIHTTGWAAVVLSWSQCLKNIAITAKIKNNSCFSWTLLLRSKFFLRCKNVSFWIRFFYPHSCLSCFKHNPCWMLLDLLLKHKIWKRGNKNKLNSRYVLRKQVLISYTDLL